MASPFEAVLLTPGIGPPFRSAPGAAYAQRLGYISSLPPLAHKINSCYLWIAFPKGIENLDLEKTADNFIKVDRYMKTSQESVYAVGDIIGGISSANAAILEGKAAAKNICGDKSAADYNGICYAFFTSPQLSGVGLREIDAKGKKISFSTKKAYFEDNFRTLTKGYERGFIKLIIDNEQDILLGAHFVGDEVSELTPLLALACKEKVSLAAIKELPLAHPTMSEI
ncbi:FAD-dependent oxidoreductase, partial [Halomonas sp.]|uniref:FAD-dependent oxidoreductase n=1 Tax=Halomonas sp. TaxID=1486246 RepID=UPI0025C2F4F5